jgi:hypothetical protein
MNLPQPFSTCLSQRFKQPAGEFVTGTRLFLDPVQKVENVLSELFRWKRRDKPEGVFVLF